ncbi:heavy metal translocating P-type ATPase [Streptomyces sp. DSM 44915]|uniref:Heavy metal translocating P-type ATPase n=2 Tax=Streptomyces chisholmiae TaxID=3075540 RepID=A0ABU2JUE9_9ACTN|nr:heavy metal translocating P-type ATPase [Streptomyces sp. DSM 44915]MDT0268615.1 heavy metal translocating P-type ATPase [Streptomyces sp. DSM 44915]
MVTGTCLAAGAVCWWVGAATAADVLWSVGTVCGLLPALVWVGLAVRRGRTGVDLIAVLALAGSLAVGEYLAGALIALMLATGRWLESAAEQRAAHDLRALVERAPRSARRRSATGVVTVPLGQVGPDDVLVVGPGEAVPVDGRVVGPTAVLDESALTGEPELVERAEGDRVRSGSVNGGDVFEIRATSTEADSAYAEIVRLARQAGAEGAPVVRLADRYAAWFVPVSLAICGLAWLLSGDPVRAVAVLVVATPCPLLLAAPVAIVSGLARAARRGVVVRDGGALERLGHARTVVLDKTGTLTAGRPWVTEVAVAAGWTAGRVLRMAASVDQYSPHVLARALVDEARSRSLELSAAREVAEEPGRGARGVVEGAVVSVGRREEGGGEPPAWARAAENRAVLDGAAVVWVAVDEDLVGAVLLKDPLRTDAPRTVRRLREAGIRRILMLTGDRPTPAREIATVLGLDEVRAEQSPPQKVDSVRSEQDAAVTVMVGDGVNDAPALAAADIGVAMGATGAGASSEAADVVLTTDRVDRLADAVTIAGRARRIAVQSAVGGMALSLAAMVVAAFGLLPPAAGALAQECIDVAVILNALRVLRSAERRVEPGTRDLLRRFAAEHERLREVIEATRQAAEALSTSDPAEALPAVRQVERLLRERLLPHERAEEHELYPALAAWLGSAEATATMSRAHLEIEGLTNRLTRHLALADQTGPEGTTGLRPEQISDLRDCLYGLHAVLRLHFAQEEENYFSLDE